METNSVFFIHPTAEIVYQRKSTENKFERLRTRLTIAYRASDSNDSVEYAVAFTAPTDNFNRKTGRNIASARLRGIPVSVKVSQDEDLFDTIVKSLKTRLPCRWVNAEFTL